jgi:RimJ/RimL family protein N-acetyltransferase
LHREDAADITALIGVFDVARWLTMVPQPYQHADALEFIDELQVDDTVWGISTDGPVIGVVSIKPELGYWLGKPFWGRGIMSEATQAVVAAYFDTTEATLKSGYHVGNAGSANVLSKLGFVPGGTRKAFAKSMQTEVSIQEMSLSQAAWQARS